MRWKEKHPMRATTKLYLRYSEWPRADKALWRQAFEPKVDLFDGGGPGAHLSERSVQQLQYAYGKFLYFLSAEHRDLLKRTPGRRLNARIIEEYVNWQPETCGRMTVSVYLYHLWFTLRYLCPKDDWRWLLVISQRLKAQAKPKPEKHHLVTSAALYTIGIRLMDTALACGRPPTSWRVQTGFRDGLIIALLALIPLRRRTLSALRIGKQLLKSGDRWVLDIPAEDVKTRRPLDYPISRELSERIDVYVNQIRSRTAGADAHDYLWACSRGGPMRGRGIYAAVRRRTRKALGFPINLHRFRRAAATFWSIRDPANVRGAKDLLGHASFATTEKYYVMSQSRLAGRALAKAISHVANGVPASSSRSRIE
jgi:integrase/recombinase XerD